MRSPGRYVLTVTIAELDIILEALWCHKQDLNHRQPAAAPGVDSLRRRLLRDSVVADQAQDATWSMAALPPEST